MIDRRTALVWWLRILGGSTLLALPAVFLPTAQMAAIHEWLGLGPFPHAALTEYLARSLSLFYALIGALLILLAGDVRRYRPAIVYAGWGSVVAGAIMLYIDLYADMPFWWTWHEGPAAAGCGALILVLVRGVPSDRQDPA